MKKIGKTIAIAAGIMLCLGGQARAQGAAPASAPERRVALGVSLDLLPAALSGAAGTFGLGGETWVGIDHVRVRLAGAKFRQPEFLLNSDNFHKLETTALAMIYDYTFGPNFDRWRLGAGVELWMNEMENKITQGRINWDSGVLTAGGGYIFRLPKNFYLELWGGGHLVMNNRKLTDPVANPETQIVDSITLQPISGEVSLRVGWYFNIPGRNASPAKGVTPAPPPAKGGTAPQPKRTP